MEVEIVQAALDVLRACVNHAHPLPEDVRALRKTMGAQAEGMPADELARAVIERYLGESKQRAKRAAQS
jgi:hypothetical protein